MLTKPPISSDLWVIIRWLQRVWQRWQQEETLTTQTSSYTVPENIFYVRADATSATMTVTIPPAVGRDGRKILVCKVDSSGNAVTVAATGTDTIQGSASISLAAQWNKALLISNGNNGWERLI